MASFKAPSILTYIATADLSAKINHMVKLGADAEHIVIGAANTDKCIGILMNKPEAGQFGEVALQGGGAKLKIAESVTFGDELVSDANGQGVKANALGDWVVAIAMDSGVSGDIIPVEVVQHKAVEAE